MEPATQRGRSGVAYDDATSLATRAAATLSSWARSAMPYSARVSPRLPKLSVSTTSQPDVEVGGVEAGDELGSGDDEQLVAALEIGPAEVVGGEAGGLDAGAHGAVVDDDPFTGGGEEIAHGWFSWRVEDEEDLRRKLGPSRPTHQDSSGARHGTRAPAGSRPGIRAPTGGWCPPGGRVGSAR